VPDDPTYPPVPQAERHLLALHALRQRQLRTAFLHGRRRTWRDRRRLWPAVVVGLLMVAVLLAGGSVLAAFQHQQQIDTAPTSSSMAQISSPPPIDTSASTKERPPIDTAAEH